MFISEEKENTKRVQKTRCRIGHAKIPSILIDRDLLMTHGFGCFISFSDCTKQFVHPFYHRSQSFWIC